MKNNQWNLPELTKAQVTSISDFIVNLNSEDMINDCCPEGDDYLCFAADKLLIAYGFKKEYVTEDED